MRAGSVQLDASSVLPTTLFRYRNTPRPAPPASLLGDDSLPSNRLSRSPPQPLNFLAQPSKYRPLEAPQNFPPPFTLVSHSCLTFSDGLPALETGSVLCSLPVVPLLTRGLPLGLLLFPCISPVEIGASQGPSPFPQ